MGLSWFYRLQGNTHVCFHADAVMQDFIASVKNTYKRNKLKRTKSEQDDWPPCSPKGYTNLALIYQKEIATKKNVAAKTRWRRNGKIENIALQTKSTQLNSFTEIFKPFEDGGEIPNSVLLEGHPGIGKTTLVKEMCLEWSQGKIMNFTQLVLLLTLRDPKVQEITNELELVQYFEKSEEKAITIGKMLMHTEGEGITFFIDGFDELSTEQREESFFWELIEGNVFPNARIVVTSRPSASACLHNYVDRVLEILGFEKSSRKQYMANALKRSPDQLKALQKHLQDNPNMDSQCYVPLNMAIMVYLCQLGALPETATSLNEQFVLHIVCHYLLRMGKLVGEGISKVSDFPHPVPEVIKQLQETAYNALERDQIVFTAENLPEHCREDPTCYGLLQSTECYSTDSVGAPTLSFNFLHLGIQEYLAAKHVASLPEETISVLLRQSFLLLPRKNDLHNNKITKLSNMWVLFCGITGGKSEALMQYVSGDGDGSVSQNILVHQKKVLYLFRCFQEAQNEKLCEALANSIKDDRINFSHQKLLPYQIISLGFFLTKSKKVWKELVFEDCHLYDNDLAILHQYLGKNTQSVTRVLSISFFRNELTDTSSDIINDLIKYLQPTSLVLSYNSFTENGIATILNNAKSIENLALFSCKPVYNKEVLSTAFIGLKSLTISGSFADALVNVIGTAISLQKLALRDMGSYAGALKLLTNSISNNTSLKFLHIQGASHSECMMCLQDVRKCTTLTKVVFDVTSGDQDDQFFLQLEADGITKSSDHLTIEIGSMEYWGLEQGQLVDYD